MGADDQVSGAGTPAPRERVTSEAIAERARATIERNRALLALSADRPDPRQAQLRRAAAMRAGRRPDLRTAAFTGQNAALRERLVGLAMELTEVEENVAHAHDEIARRRPEQSAELRRIAEQARAAASAAREVARRYGG